MTAVFFSKRYFNIDNVYSEESKRRLAEKLTFIAPIKSEKELEARKEETVKVDYIFSTWGMPALSKEEVQRYFPNLKHVFYAAGTVQSFARPFLELGIPVHSAWRANGIPVAGGHRLRNHSRKQGLFPPARPLAWRLAQRRSGLSFPGQLRHENRDSRRRP